MSGPTLRRSLTLPLLTLYGLGTILGAGIYVLIAAVAAEAGTAMPLSFLLAATIAGFTAFSYAELASRFPRSAGEVVYTDKAFGVRTFSGAIGYALVFVGVVSAATISRGFIGYLGVFAEFGELTALGVLVLSLGALAALGIVESAAVVAVVTVIGIAGLLFVVAAAYGTSGETLPGADFSPATMNAAGVMTGAFLAFYAYIGYEDMVNVAEEVKHPERTMPRAIVLALVLSTTLYVLVAFAALASLPVAELARSEAPLADVVAARGFDPRIISGISLLAVIDGALVQIIMASRVLYGMARQGVAPAAFGRVFPRTRTPLLATGTATVLVLTFAVALPLVRLAALTSAVTLLVFAAVNAALWHVKRDGARPEGGVSYPRWVPATGFVLSVGLFCFAFVVG